MPSEFADVLARALAALGAAFFVVPALLACFFFGAALEVCFFAGEALFFFGPGLPFEVELLALLFCGDVFLFVAIGES